MPPILQTLIALAISILLRRLLLSKMPFAIRNYLPHMREIIYSISIQHLKRIA